MASPRHAVMGAPNKGKPMNSPQLGLRVAGAIFGLVCLAHLVRLFIHFQVMVGSHPVPLWMNGGACVVTGLLAFWLWRLSVPAGSPEPPAKT